MKKVEHIGIAVHDLKKAEALYSKLFDRDPYKRETVESENVITSFFKIGSTKVELLEAINEHSVVAKYLAKNREGIHHIAFEVEDIRFEMKRLEQEGFIIMSKTPKKGADNKLVCFIHPKSANGVLIELCQERT